MTTQMRQQGEQLAAKRSELAEIFAKHKDESGNYKPSMDQSVIEDIRNRQNELTELGKSYDAAREIFRIEQDNAKGLNDLNRPVNDLATATGPSPRERKSLGEILVNSPEFKSFSPRSSNGNITINVDDYDAKTLMTTSAGVAPDNPRTNIFVMSPQPRILLPSLIPQGNTDLTSIRYMTETTFTNNAAARTEGAAAGEMVLVFTEASAAVETVSHYIPITEEQMEDVPQVQSLAEGRLAFGVDLKVQYYLLNGSGTPPQIRGFLNATNLQTTAKAVDEPVFDAILRAITNVRTSGGTADVAAEPSALVINPVDWQNLVLTRTADGLYILGNPGAPAPERVWGMLPAPTVAMTQGTSLIGDFLMFSHISNKKGMTIEYGWINDDFKKFIRGIRASRRLSLEIYRGAAFCTVTSL